MKLLIDNSNLFAGGGIQVAISFLNDLNSLNLENEYFIIQSDKIKDKIDKNAFSSNFHFIDLDNINLFSKRRIVKNIENTVSPDVIFTVFGPSYHKSNFPKVVGFAIPHIIYSNSPFFKMLNLLELFKIKLLSQIKAKMFLKNSDGLIFETNDAKKIFIKKYKPKKKCFEVNNTLNEVFLDNKKWEKVNFNDNGEFKIALVTANYPHKNLQLLPNIIKVLKEVYKWNNFKFIITVRKEELNFDDEINNYIEFLGPLRIEQIPELYNKINLVFAPTLLEVFSTTYLEAMFMKKPLVVSDMTFARDICGDSAIFCAPLNAQEYANAIFSVYKNNGLVDNLIKNGVKNLSRFGSSKDRTKKYLNILNMFSKRNQLN